MTGKLRLLSLAMSFALGFQGLGAFDVLVINRSGQTVNVRAGEYDDSSLLSKAKWLVSRDFVELENEKSHYFQNAGDNQIGYAQKRKLRYSFVNMQEISQAIAQKEDPEEYHAVVVIHPDLTTEFAVIIDMDMIFFLEQYRLKKEALVEAENKLTIIKRDIAILEKYIEQPEKLRFLEGFPNMSFDTLMNATLTRKEDIEELLNFLEHDNAFYSLRWGYQDLDCITNLLQNICNLNKDEQLKEEAKKYNIFIDQVLRCLIPLTQAYENSKKE